MGEGALIFLVVICFIVLSFIAVWMRTPVRKERIGPVEGALDLTNTPGKLVTIAIFDSPVEANLYKSRLEVEDIECFLEDEHIVIMYWLYWNAVGGVKLKVKESDAQKAMSALKGKMFPAEPEAEAVGTERRIQCPKCNSTAVYYQKLNRRLSFLTMFLDILFPVIPFIPIPKRKWQCKSCGYEWKVDVKQG